MSWASSPAFQSKKAHYRSLFSSVQCIRKLTNPKWNSTRTGTALSESRERRTRKRLIALYNYSLYFYKHHKHLENLQTLYFSVADSFPTWLGGLWCRLFGQILGCLFFNPSSWSFDHLHFNLYWGSCIISISEPWSLGSDWAGEDIGSRDSNTGSEKCEAEEWRDEWATLG